MQTAAQLRHPAQLQQSRQDSVELAQARIPPPNPQAHAEQPPREHGLCRCMATVPPTCQDIWQCTALHSDKAPVWGCSQEEGPIPQLLHSSRSLADASGQRLAPRAKEPECHSIPVSSVNPCPEPHHKGWNISVAQCVILQVQLSCSA